MEPCIPTIVAEWGIITNMLSKLVLAFILGVSTILFSKAVLEMDRPLDCDEKGNLEFFQKNELHTKMTNPVRNDSHALASFGSYLSMKAFGPGIIQSRIAALVFTAILLGVLGYFSYQYLSTLTVVLLYLHFFSNESASWYFHSGRGYAPVMAEMLFAFFLVWTAITQEVKKPRLALLGFLGCTLLAFLTHHVGLVFIGILSLALLCWTTVNRNRLPPTQFSWAIRYFYAFLWALPPMALVLFVNILFLRENSRGYAGAGFSGGWTELQSVYSSIFAGLGTFRRIWQYLVPTGLLGLLCLGWRHIKSDPRINFLWILLATFFATFGFIAIYTGTTYWVGRFFVAFSFLFVLVFGETISKIEWKITRHAFAGFAFLTLVFAPFRESNPVIVTNLCEMYEPISLTKQALFVPLKNIHPNVLSALYEKNEILSLDEGCTTICRKSVTAHLP